MLPENFFVCNKNYLRFYKENFRSAIYTNNFKNNRLFFTLQIVTTNDYWFKSSNEDALFQEVLNWKVYIDSGKLPDHLLSPVKIISIFYMSLFSIYEGYEERLEVENLNNGVINCNYPPILK